MITGYFGVPGCGKTTILTSIAQKELKKIKKGKSKYEQVYTNFYCQGCKKIDFKQLKDYRIDNGLILLDEISLDADNREYKTFPFEIRNFFILHRHLGDDIIYFTQDYGKVDKVIRSLTNDLYYTTKSAVPILNNWSVSKQIYRNITINEYTSELTLGYRFATILEKIFGKTKKITYRPKWYKYFDSFDEMQMKDIPKLPLEEWTINQFDDIVTIDGIDLILKE